MRMDEFIVYLDGVKPNGRGYTALCPAHNDHDPSLSVSEGDDGQVLLHCFAGCKPGEVVQALGLQMSDLFPGKNGKGWTHRPIANGKPSSRPMVRKDSKPGRNDLCSCGSGLKYKKCCGAPQQIVAEYDYRGENGDLLYQIVRKEPGKNGRKKDFSIRRLDGAGGWTYNSKGVTLVPYRLPELLAADVVVIVEGEGKVDALAKLNIVATCNPFGAGKWPKDFRPYLEGKKVIIWPDKDDAGQKHADQVASLLQDVAASIRMVQPPGELPEKGDVKDGVETLGWTREDVQRILDQAEAWEPQPEEKPADQTEDGVYRVEGGCIGYMKIIGRGENVTEIFVPLCNFAARVTEERILDNGVEATRRFKVEGRLSSGEYLPPAEVTATQFSPMNWIVDQWGMRACVSAGMGAKDRLREAIQVFSTDAETQYTYIHTGWRKIAGAWCFLHAGRADVQVSLESPLNRYALPVVAEDVADSIQYSLKLLEVGPDEVVIPLLAAAYLAPLCEFLHPDFVIFLVGKTGSLKSTLAALFLSHYGQFDRTNLPASWESTDNALEKRLFTLKDVLCIVDDYAPRADAYAQRKQAQRAQRIIRSMGNLSGRSRLKADLTERPEYVPRGLMVSTGEDLPPGQSILARILSVEVDREKLDLERLTEAQRHAHRLPHAMAGYIHWLAPQLDNLASQLREQWEQHRTRFARDAAHLRIPEILAYLALGIDLLTSFARDHQVLPEDQIRELSQRTYTTLCTLGEMHGQRVQEEDPAEVFLSTLSAMLAQGTVKLSHRDAGQDPLNMIGWNDADYAYLIPRAAHQSVSRYLREGGGHFPYSARALNEALDKRDALVKGADGRPTRLVKIRTKNRRVLQISMELLEPNEENDDEEQR